MAIHRPPQRLVLLHDRRLVHLLEMMKLGRRHRILHLLLRLAKLIRGLRMIAASIEG